MFGEFLSYKSWLTWGTVQVVGGAQWTNGLFIPFFAFVGSRMSLDLLELNKRKLMGSTIAGTHGNTMIGLAANDSSGGTALTTMRDVHHSNFTPTSIDSGNGGSHQSTGTDLTDLGT
jgi:hypothetical protein